MGDHILRWIATFLMDRAQKVKISNYLSRSGSPNGGVPQGTLLGPKCFLAYINDLHTPCALYKYVDDTTIFEVCHRNEVSVIQESIDIATQWITENDMKINSDKSKEMTICFARDNDFLHDMPNLNVDRMPVQKVRYAKLLGITISCDLTWNRHIENIVAKAGKRLYVLYQLKRAGISQADLITVYLSIIRPVLEYACPAWHTNLQVYLSNNIELIQKRALRCIYPGEIYQEILNSISLSTLKDRRDLICKRYFNKMKDASHKLNHLLPGLRDVQYDMRHCNRYELPLTRTNRYKDSLVPWGLNNCQ